MIRVALLGVVIVIVVGATIMVAGRLINPAETPSETITSRFPEGWEAAPVVEYKRPQHWPSAMPRMSADEFIAAVTAVGGGVRRKARRHVRRSLSPRCSTTRRLQA